MVKIWRRPVREMNERLEQRVTGTTLARYRAAFVTLIHWIVSAGLILMDYTDLDYALVEFGETCATLGAFSLTISAIGFFMPHVKQYLLVSNQYKRGWEFEKGISHTVPMIWVFVLAFAQAFILLGWMRLGAGIMVQYGFYLRPGELLGLTTEDIILPEFHHFANKASAYLVLGMRTRGTKVKREQTVECSNKHVVAALRFLYLHTPKGERLMNGITYAEYRTQLMRAAKLQGLEQLDFTAHSPRPGAATEDLINHVSFNTVKEKGRWLADNSARVYLDRAKALAANTVKKGRMFAKLVADPSLVGKVFVYR